MTEFTKVPNFFFEHMSDMDKCEQSVVLYVIRKTVGFQKEWDEISFSQFIDGTGLGKASVNAGVKSAMKRGILQRRIVKNSFEYCITDPSASSENKSVQNMNSSISEPTCSENGSEIELESVQNLNHSTQNGSENEPVQKPNGSEIEPKTVQNLNQSDEKTVQNLNTQKKDNTKEINKTTTTTSGGSCSLNSESSAVDDEWRKVVEAYESNIGMFTSMTSDMVKDAYAEYGSTLIVEAIKTAVSQNVRKWSYVDGVLKRWRASGKQPSQSANHPQKQQAKTVTFFNVWSNQTETKVIQ